MVVASAVVPVTLEGFAVRLEPLALEHIAGLAAAASGPRDSYGFTLVPDGEASTERYVRTAIEERERGVSLPFATVDRVSGVVVGSTRFMDIQYWSWPEGNPNQRGVEFPDAVEIGHTWITPAAQRSAINTEAKLLMLSHAFEPWRVHKVFLKTDARNERSRNAILRLGTKFDGVVRAQMPAYDGGIRDTAYYSMLDSEWPDEKAALSAKLR